MFTHPDLADVFHSMAELNSVLLGGFDVLVYTEFDVVASGQEMVEAQYQLVMTLEQVLDLLNNAVCVNAETTCKHRCCAVSRGRLTSRNVGRKLQTRP